MPFTVEKLSGGIKEEPQGPWNSSGLAFKEAASFSLVHRCDVIVNYFDNDRACSIRRYYLGTIIENHDERLSRIGE